MELQVTRQLTVLRAARNAVRFAVWNFAWTALWSIATYTTVPGAQGNEGDVQFAVVGITLSSLTRDVSDIPDPRCELAPPVEGKWRLEACPVSGNALQQWGWRI